MGHPIKLHYKGNESHPTVLGSLCSIGIIALVLVQLVLKSIDLVYMNDPSITSFTRTLYQSESEEYGQMSLHDYMFDIGVMLTDAN